MPVAATVSVADWFFAMEPPAGCEAIAVAGVTVTRAEALVAEHPFAFVVVTA